MSGWTEEDLRARVQGRAAATPPVVRTVAYPPATGRIAKPEMNKTEARYAAHLEIQQHIGAVVWWGFETFTLKLGKDCRLTLDFLVMFPDGHLEFHDTKGASKIKVGKKAGQTKPRVEDDALAKARIAAANCVIPVYFVWPEASGEWSKREL